MNFNKRLKKLREENNLTQKKLGEILGISEQAVSNYERGNRKPDHDLLMKIANFFNVSVDYLLGKSNERSPADKIKETISDDPELLKFWDELKEREDLQMMFKQTRELPPETIQQIIQIIRTFEKEQDEKYNG